MLHNTFIVFILLGFDHSGDEREILFSEFVGLTWCRGKIEIIEEITEINLKNQVRRNQVIFLLMIALFNLLIDEAGAG